MLPVAYHKNLPRKNILILISQHIIICTCTYELNLKENISGILIWENYSWRLPFQLQLIILYVISNLTQII